MGTPLPDLFCTSCAWFGSTRTGACERCGSNQLAKVARGGIVEIPAGEQPCDRCGTLDEPLKFRGSARLIGMIVVSHETRPAGYYCEDCARRRAALYLAITGAVGWWSLVGFVFRAPRATFYNWRAVWTHPRSPVAWGAHDVADVTAEIEARRVDTWKEPSAPEFEPVR